MGSAQDRILARLERAGMTTCAPELNEERDPQYWYDQPGAPFPRWDDEREPPETIDYDTLVQTWAEGR